MTSLAEVSKACDTADHMPYGDSIRYLLLGFRHRKSRASNFVLGLTPFAFWAGSAAVTFVDIPALRLRPARATVARVVNKAGAWVIEEF